MQCSPPRLAAIRCCCRSKRKFNDENVCKYYLCGFCPYEVRGLQPCLLVRSLLYLEPLCVQLCLQAAGGLRSGSGGGLGGGSSSNSRAAAAAAGLE